VGRIRVLSDVVANKIAAGEVVERPASVVKELLENSLDAGATDLRIDIETGGRRLIRITDDGCGMLRDDALLAFERHATSKLSDVADLLAISTLGFRGEALPSIASVARLTLETRDRSEDTGTRVEIAGGKILRCDEAALTGGTVLTVRDLFYNVPARKKFLRSEQTELAHIATLVTHYALAHPGKSFLLRNGAAELLHVTPAAEPRDRVFQVFGAELLEDLVDLGTRQTRLALPPPYIAPGEQQRPDEPPSPEHRHFTLRGFVSRPQVQKLNRNSIYLFVNGRVIRDKLLLHALSSAYHNLMPPGCFPFALLFLDCDCEEVDVNVHPSKTEVRFRHGSFVHDFLRDAVREVLSAARPVARAAVEDLRSPGQAQPAATLPFSEFSQQRETELLGQAFNPWSAPAPQQRLTFGDSAPEPAPPPVEDAAIRLRVPDTHAGFPEGWTAAADMASMARLEDLRPLGQLHESFIIAAGRDGLWIIDQHVAHERILFEQVLKQARLGRGERQRLLMPIVLPLTPAQEVEYARIADELERAGFETEPFGHRTIAIKASPAGVGAGDIERVVREVLEIAESELRRASVEDLRRGISATIACRAAIKINTRLDMAKMQWMLEALSRTEYPMACPHGRPVALRYSTRDILRGFHRM